MCILSPSFSFVQGGGWGVVRRFTKNELEGKWLGEENEENGVDKEHPGITSSISNVVSGGHSAAGYRAKKFISSSLSSKARSDGLQPVDQLRGYLRRDGGDASRERGTDWEYRTLPGSSRSSCAGSAAREGGRSAIWVRTRARVRVSRSDIRRADRHRWARSAPYSEKTNSAARASRCHYK